MTENEAIEILEERYLTMSMCGDIEQCKRNNQAISAAVKALTEIQQYRAIGTVEECREAREKQEPMHLYNREAPFIGKSTKIQYHCPQCDIILGVGISPEEPIIQEEIRYCFNCGQKLYR